MVTIMLVRSEEPAPFDRIQGITLMIGAAGLFLVILDVALREVASLPDSITPKREEPVTPIFVPGIVYILWWVPILMLVLPSPLRTPEPEKPLKTRPDQCRFESLIGRKAPYLEILNVILSIASSTAKYSKPSALTSYLGQGGPLWPVTTFDLFRYSPTIRNRAKPAWF